MAKWYEDPAYMTRGEYQDAERRRNLHAWTQWRTDANDRIIQGRARDRGPPLVEYLEGDRYPVENGRGRYPPREDPAFGLMGYSAEYNKVTELPKGGFLQYGIPRAKVNVADPEYRRLWKGDGDGRDGRDGNMYPTDRMMDERPSRRDYMEDEPQYGRVLPKAARRPPMGDEDPYGRLPARRNYVEEDPYARLPVSPRMTRKGPPGPPPQNGPREFAWEVPGYGAPPREYRERQPRPSARPPANGMRPRRSHSEDPFERPGRRPGPQWR